jgi:PAS domain S-box-containing protein
MHFAFRTRLRAVSPSIALLWLVITTVLCLVVVRTAQGDPGARAVGIHSVLHTVVASATVTLNSRVLTPLEIPDSSPSSRTAILFFEPFAQIRYPRGIEVLAALTILETLLLAFLLIERRARKQSQESLGRRLALEQQISDLSTRFAASSPEQIDHEIREGLEQVRKLVGADRAYWYQNPRGSSAFECMYYACGPNVTPPPALVVREELPLIMSLLLAGAPVRLDKLTDLPEAAIHERAFFQNLKTKSVVLVPADAGLSTKGLLGLGSATAEREWTSDLISQLGVMSFVIASVVQRKNAQLARQASEQRFSRLFEGASIGIALEGPGGHLDSVNPAFCEMTGYTKEELLQLSCQNLSHPDDLPAENILFEELWDGKRKSYQMDKRFFRKDGSVFWAHISVSLLRNQDGPPLVIGMAKDISESKASQEQLTAAKVELQRLTARLIQAQDNERGRISRELHDDVGQRLSLLSVHLDTLQQQLAALGNVSAAQRVSDLRHFAGELGSDIHDLSHELHSSKLQHLGLRAALKDLCERVSVKDQFVVTFLADGLTNHLPSDVALCLFRVAQEALNNVLKHSHSSRASIEVVESGRVIALKITDSGNGFDPASCQWGIGLTSMRERLRIVGGELVVRSALGAGTEITAEVKLEQAAAAQAGKS